MTKVPKAAYAAGAPIAGLAFAAAALAVARPVEAQINDCKDEQGSDIPCLKIDIPNVTFSPVKRIEGANTDTIVVPFLAQYIAGVYQYGIGAALVVAAVMTVVGGFEWLTAGDSGRISKAKDRIMNAVIGLVLALGAYAILNTVDPTLVTLQGLSINVVKPIQLDDNLLTSTEDTTEGTAEPVAGSHSTQYPGCPFSLDTPGTDKKPNWDRVNEFDAKMRPLITGTTTEEKILQVADAAAACGVNLGACGMSVGRIKMLAGVAPDICRTKILFSCWGRQTKALPVDLHARIKNMRCPSDGKVVEGCVSDKKEATAKVLKTIKEANLPGWPDEWANGLKPGDTVVVYNGNPTGTHSMIFVGWSSDKKNIQVVHGSYERNVKSGSQCVTSACGDAQVPIVKIFHTD